MKIMEQIKGNSLTLNVSHLLDENSSPIDLTSITNAIFVIKQNQTDETNLVYVDIPSGGVIVDVAGNKITIIVSATLMENIDLGTLYFALQLKFPGDIKIEVQLSYKGQLSNQITINQNTVS